MIIMKMQTTDFSIVLCSAQDLDLRLYMAMQSIRLNEQLFAINVIQVLAANAVIVNLICVLLTLLMLATFYYSIR